MKQVLFFYLAWPLVALGFLLVAACLTGVWYINKLDTDLGRAVTHDVRHLQAAEEMQIWLRQLRFHSLLYAAQKTRARHEEVLVDEKGFEAALDEFRKGTDSEEDTDLADKIAEGYDRYKSDIDPPDEAASTALQGNQLWRWSDDHRVEGLLVPRRKPDTVGQ